MKNLVISVFMLTLLFAYSCKKDDDKSDKNDILTFSLAEQADSAIIDSEGKQITIKVKEGTNLATLKPVLTVSEKATVSPASAATVNFTTNPVKFTVTAEDGTTQEWSVSVFVKIESFIVANLNNREISAIVVDGANTKWIGTDTGLFSNVESGFKLQEIALPGKIISLGYEKNANVLWIGTEGGLVKASLGTDITSTVISASNLTNSVVNVTYTDAGSRHWFGTNTGVTLNKADVYKKKNFLRNLNNQDVAAEFEDAKISSIAFWDGDYFFATIGKALYRAYGYDASFDGFTGATQWDYPYNGEAIDDTMYVVFVDSKGNQWMGGTMGVQSHSGHLSKEENTYYGDKLPGLTVRAIAEAPNGDIWVGTEKGLAVYNGTSWSTKSDKFITAIAFESNGKAWVGTSKGLINY